MHFMNPIGLLGLFFENDLLILHPFSSSRSAGQHEAAIVACRSTQPSQSVSQRGTVVLVVPGHAFALLDLA